MNLHAAAIQYDYALSIVPHAGLRVLTLLAFVYSALVRDNKSLHDVLNMKGYNNVNHIVCFQVCVSSIISRWLVSSIVVHMWKRV